MCKTIASLFAPKIPESVTAAAKQRTIAAQKKVSAQKDALLDDQLAFNSRSLLAKPGSRGGFA